MIMIFLILWIISVFPVVMQLTFVIDAVYKLKNSKWNKEEVKNAINAIRHSVPMFIWFLIMTIALIALYIKWL